MFSVGDKVVYPMHGAGTIESIEEKEMLGNIDDYYIIKMPIGGIKLMVPTSKVDDIGVREISALSEAEKVFDVLEKPKDPYVQGVNWSKRYNLNVEKIKSGNLLEVAEVVRELSHRHMERGLSIGEKKMLVTSRNILLSEMVLAENQDKELLEGKIDSIIKDSYTAGIMDEASSASEDNIQSL